MYETDIGMINYEVTGGVPQGSVLEPILWNVLYDQILRLNLSEGVKLVGFADDIIIEVAAKHLFEI